jgi:hypothetical protein
MSRAMAAKKTVNKTQFVKSLPSDMPAKDVIAKGKEQGISLTEAYVYSIRAKSKAASRGGARRAGRPAAPAAGGSARGSGGGALAAEIERLVERKVEDVLQRRLAALFSK